MRSSITGRKCRIRPWIGHAAASPSAQIVWPSTCRVTCSSVSISSSVGAPFDHAGHDAPHPAGALAARRALAAAFMHVEFRQPRDRLDHVGGLVHDDDRRGAQAAARTSRRLSKSISTVVADRLRDQRHRGAARNDRQQIVPAAAHAAGIFLDQFLAAECQAPPRHCTACSHGRRCRKLSARCCSAGPSAANHAAPRRRIVGATAMRLDIVHRGRAAVQPDAGRERRLHPRHALLAFKAFQQRGFFAADIGAGAAMQEHIEILAGAAGVLADQPGRVGLVDRGLQHAASL